MDAAVAALLGAAIGAIGTVGNAWLQQRYQTKREAMKSAVDLGIRDFNHTFELMKSRGGGNMPPLSIFVAYHTEVLQALAADDFGPEAVQRIDKKQRDALEAIANRGPAKKE